MRRVLRWVLRSLLVLVVLLGAAGGVFYAGQRWLLADGARHSSRSRYDHGMAVHSLAFSLDGQRLYVSGAGDTRAYETGPSAATRLTPAWSAPAYFGRPANDASHLVAVSPDGRLVATANNPWWPKPERKGKLRVLDARSGSELAVLAEDLRAYDSLAFTRTASGLVLAACSNEYGEHIPLPQKGSVDFWQLEGLEGRTTVPTAPASTVTRGDQPILSFAFLPDGRHLFVSRRRNPADGFFTDGEIVIGADAGAQAATVVETGPDPLLRAVLASPDGGTLAATFDRSPVVRFFDPQGKALFELRAGSGATRLFGAGAFSPDGHHFFFPSDEHAGPSFFRPWTRTIGVWRLGGGMPERVALLALRSLDEKVAIHALAVSPDGQQLAAGYGTPFAGSSALLPLAGVLP